MPADDLVRSRASLVIGAGQTTRKNRVLPAAIVDPQIPPRIGVAPVRLPKTKASAIWHRGFTTVEIAGTMPPRRFDPYTLGTLDFPYGIGVVGYDVTTWASGWNVIDQLPWYDVVCFWNGKILINAAELADLQIPSATLAAPAMPYAIPYQAGSEWGNQTINQVEKRVFAIGRSHVQAFNVGGTLAILSPAQPRADGKAMTIGQRIDRAQHKAWLGQLYYTGAFWDSSPGSWQFSSSEVALLLVTPFLQQTAGSANVEMAIAAILGSGASSNGNKYVYQRLPQVPVAIIGIGEVHHTGNWPTDMSFPGWSVIWPHRQLYYASPLGYEYQWWDRASWSASVSDTVIQCGRNVDYSQSNVKNFDDWYSDMFTSAEEIPLPVTPYAPGSLTSYSLGSENDVLVWSDGNQRGPFPARGSSIAVVQTRSIPGSTIHQPREQQTLTSRVTCGSVNLIDLSIVVSRFSGQTRTLTPDLSDWNPFLANPYGGLPITAFVSQVERGISPLVYHKNPSGQLQDQSAQAIAEINADFSARQAAYVGTEHYYDPWGYYYPHNVYSCSVGSVPTTSTASLSWTTTDHLLRDDINGVRIGIKGEFVGSQTGPTGSATLTVTLQLATRYHTLNQQLLQRSYSYADLLPEATIGNNRTAVPSPQIRAIYAPLYQEQGAFKGASYITAAEETANSTPAHLFNFQLRLHNLADLGQINGLNLSTDVVHFCPINLCEMLYAFVFSQDYGIGRTTAQRYPVTDSTKYNDLMNTLFSDVYPVLVRDGVFGAWATSLNGNSAGLYRT